MTTKAQNLPSHSPENAKGPKWIGVLLGVLLPCFGFVWAGQYKRAAVWLSVLTLSSVLALLLLATGGVPVIVVGICVLLVVAIQLASYVKSYQRGRMTAARWVMLMLYGSTFYLAPHPTHLVARTFRISGESMAPTLRNDTGNGTGDWLVANRLSYLFSDPKRGDVVVIDTSKVPALLRALGPEGQTYYVFRVLGLPGERIEIADGKVFADGRKLGVADGAPDIDYLSHTETLARPSESIKLPNLNEREYLVLGDNPSDSLDSRFWGAVPRAAILGRATRIYYPLSRLDAPLFPKK